ncbi:hypothetical protein OS493_025582 [Desmophyllum pertusum]|uniref:Uncharacterized protein n=1 Tax=Desmophyllum pertusum TaxID=174260 RepID=A0A9W9ZYQ4_9CNID|nr:hypothetical protein OS493_025582 [Desmophyllum pertusum]
MGLLCKNTTSVRYKLDIVKEDNETYSCEVKNNDQLAKKELVLSLKDAQGPCQCTHYKGTHSLLSVICVGKQLKSIPSTLLPMSTAVLSTPLVKERITIFGKTAHDLPKLINSVLSIDVNIYSESDLFVCTNPCYKRLLKLEKLEKNIADLKKELRSSFDCTWEPARVKRLRKDSDTVSASTSTSSTTTNRPGASKSLTLAL